MHPAAVPKSSAGENSVVDTSAVATTTTQTLHQIADPRDESVSQHDVVPTPAAANCVPTAKRLGSLRLPRTCGYRWRLWGLDRYDKTVWEIAERFYRGSSWLGTFARPAAMLLGNVVLHVIRQSIIAWVYWISFELIEENCIGKNPASFLPILFVAFLNLFVVIQNLEFCRGRGCLAKDCCQKNNEALDMFYVSFGFLAYLSFVLLTVDLIGSSDSSKNQQGWLLLALGVAESSIDAAPILFVQAGTFLVFLAATLLSLMGYSVAYTIYRYCCCSVAGRDRVGVGRTRLENVMRSLAEPYESRMLSAQCPICLEDYVPVEQQVVVLDCGHALHATCGTEWLATANACPMCRRAAFSADVYYGCFI